MKRAGRDKAKEREEREERGGGGQRASGRASWRESGERRAGKADSMDG